MREKERRKEFRNSSFDGVFAKEEKKKSFAFSSIFISFLSFFFFLELSGRE